MSIAAALLVIAQTAAPNAVPAPAPVAQRATASVAVLRPAQVRIASDGNLHVEVSDRAERPERRRDDAGTIWVEFS